MFLFLAVRSRRVRNQNGSILLLVVVCIGVLLPLIFFSIVGIAQLNFNHARQTSAVESASLAAASDLARIVISDPHFGYIALTDYAPVGRAVKAEDGEPLPAIGINTLWASCRSQLILAETIGNSELRDLALLELREANRATASLNSMLEAALRPGGSGRFHDINGVVVAPYDHAMEVLKANSTQYASAAVPNVERLKLSLGWLDELTDSGTPVPQPVTMAVVPNDLAFADHYRAFTNIPVGNQSFYFAALGKQSALVREKSFRLPDGKRMCSIVRAEVDLLLIDPAEAGCRRPPVEIHACACAQPGGNSDTSIPGTMRIAFEDGLVPNLSSIRSLLTAKELAASSAEVSTAVDGDYPTDAGAKLSCNELRSLTSVVALGLFDWLRSTHNKARLDSVEAMINRPFPEDFLQGKNSKPLLTYELDAKGNVVITNQQQNPYLSDVVFENQKCARSKEPFLADNGHWTLYFRDQVRHLGPDSGGKHAGQIMPPNPLNWCELSFYGCDEATAGAKLTGGNARGLTLTGSSHGCPDGSGGISAESAEFFGRNGSPLPVQPRKTYYSGGLAVEFRFLLAQAATGDEQNDQ